MNPVRKQRLIIVLIVLLGAAAAISLALVAFNENMNLFYTPTQVGNGEAPAGQRIKIGGMVRDGSFERGSELKVAFTVTDYVADVVVHYEGILPDLFREGQGVVTEGYLDDNGQFTASRVLAKHDENYMSREVQDALKAAGKLDEYKKNEKTKSRLL